VTDIVDTRFKHEDHTVSCGSLDTACVIGTPHCILCVSECSRALQSFGIPLILLQATELLFLCTSQQVSDGFYFSFKTWRSYSIIRLLQVFFFDISLVIPSDFITGKLCKKLKGHTEKELATLHQMKWILGSFTFLLGPAAAQVVNHTSQEIKSASLRYTVINIGAPSYRCRTLPVIDCKV
jgi:hypothetical protein